MSSTPSPGTWTPSFPTTRQNVSIGYLAEPTTFTNIEALECRVPTAMMRDMETDGHDAKFPEAWKWILMQLLLRREWQHLKENDDDMEVGSAEGWTEQEKEEDHGPVDPSTLWRRRSGHSEEWRIGHVPRLLLSLLDFKTQASGLQEEAGHRRKERKWWKRSRMAKARLSPKVDGHRKGAGMATGT